MNERLIDSELKVLLNTLDFDIKAESFFSYFKDDKELYFKFYNFFDRSYSNDIFDIKEPIDTDGKLQYAFLSRLGMYNIFPEAFFHNQKRKLGSENMVSEYKERKKQEKQARKFFEPLEDELFNYFLEIEKQEKEILKDLGEKEFLFMLQDIWDIDKGLPAKEMAKVIKFLPFMHKVSGDLDAITYMLEYIFNNKISVTVEPVLIEVDSNENEDLLLGNSFALTPLKTTFLKKYIFTLEEIEDLDNIHEYFNDGKMNKILSLALNYTLPFESDHEIRFTIHQNKRVFVLDDKPYSGRIGISTTLV